MFPVTSVSLPTAIAATIAGLSRNGWITMVLRGGLCQVARHIHCDRVRRQAGQMPVVNVDIPSDIHDIPSDIHNALWEKFLLVTPFGGIGAVSRAPIGIMRTMPETRRDYC
jgi:hypothetical protein